MEAEAEAGKEVGEEQRWGAGRGRVGGTCWLTVAPREEEWVTAQAGVFVMHFSNLDKEIFPRHPSRFLGTFIIHSAKILRDMPFLIVD